MGPYGPISFFGALPEALIELTNDPQERPANQPERLAEQLARLRTITEPVLAREGLELFDLELKRGPKRWLLRITLDRPGDAPFRGSAPKPGDPLPETVGIEDCSRISKLLGPLYDVEDVLPSAYLLEVGSPGVNRPLKTPAHFKRAVGLDVRVKTRVPLAPSNETFFIAPLVAAGDDALTLDVRGQSVEIPYRLVTQASIEYRF